MRSPADPDPSSQFHRLPYLNPPMTLGTLTLRGSKVGITKLFLRTNTGGPIVDPAVKMFTFNVTGEAVPIPVNFVDPNTPAATIVVSGTQGTLPSLDLHQDSADGATGLRVGVDRLPDPSTNGGVAVLLAEYQTRLSYNPACASVLDVRGLDFPVDPLSIDNATGVTTFGGSSAATSAPIGLAHALTRLLGSNLVACQLDLEMVSLQDGGGQALPIDPTILAHTLLRGDARAHGVINIADALFIAQYLVGLRPACTDVVGTTCLHSVNAASVRQDGTFDRKTIADALFIAQYMVGLRDGFYDLVP